MNPAGDGLEIRLFGSPVLGWRAEPFKPPTQKALAILCYLAAQGGQAPRRALGELLWGERYAGALRVELARLRRLPGAHAWLKVDTGTVAVKCRSDLGMFEAAVAQHLYEHAFALFTGEARDELMHGLEPRDAEAFMDWLEVERTRVGTLLRDALRAYAEDLENRGDHAGALVKVKKVLQEDPLDEGAHRAAMRLAFQMGDLQAALRQFETCRRVLAEELGLAPMPETLELAAEIERATVRPIAPGQVRTDARIPPKLLRPPVLVGREREWAEMEAAWQAGRHIFIAGPAGSGKTRLMMDFVSSKSGNYGLNFGRPGDKAIPYSSLGRCLRVILEAFPDLPLAPWVRCELARLVPDCFPETPPNMASGEDRLRLMRALEVILLEASCRFDVLPADDLHLFDSLSFELSLYLSGVVVETGLSEARVVGCFRTGELSAGHERELGRAVEAGIATRIDLAPLDQEAVCKMLAAMEVEHAEALAPRLHRLTGGHPQFIVETLKVLYAQEWAGPELPERIDLPPRVGAAIEQRLNRLTPLGLRVVRAVAALQGASPVHAGQAASILDIGLVEAGEALAELERAQLVVGGVFVHDLVHDTVLGTTPHSLASALHRRIASWLEAHGAEPARIAQHWLDAGDSNRALPWHVRAAEVALAQGVTEPARAWLREALGALEPGSELYRRASRLLRAAEQLS